MTPILVSRYPHLNHFLNGYMHQDWTLFGDNIQDAMQTYADETTPFDLIALRSEISNFIETESYQLEERYFHYFPNSANPAGWNMSIIEWLTCIAMLTKLVT